MFSTLISKILGGGVVVLLVISSLLYINKLSLEKDIIIKDNVITEVVRERNLLLQERDNRGKLQESADALAVKKDKEQKELESFRDSTLSKLNTLNNKEQQGNTNVTKTQNASPTASLDADTARLLNELCARVKGSACPNP